ncbi:MAG: hypothetical protein AB7G25_11300, partial [Sphingomonadaceae bacterium]
QHGFGGVEVAHAGRGIELVYKRDYLIVRHFFSPKIASDPPLAPSTAHLVLRLAAVIFYEAGIRGHQIDRGESR